MVVLSRGMYRRLQVDPRTLEFLAARSVAAQVAETREARTRYLSTAPPLFLGEDGSALKGGAD